VVNSPYPLLKRVISIADIAAAFEEGRLQSLLNKE
jgi:hypothetical protein